jgi:predicted transcriptional regulator
MSIRPEFADRLLAGEKRVEFRRRPAARGVTHILIYATSPVRAVVGVAEIERLEQASPRKLWDSFSEVGGICRSDFFSYFAGVTTGCAYVVKRIWSCSRPEPLGRHGLPKTAPQAFQYVGSATLEAMLDRSVAANG